MKQILNDHTLDYLMEGFQLIGFDWRYLYVNDAVARQSKLTREELIGCTMMEKYPGIETTSMFLTLEYCMVERESTQIENEFIYPDGSIAWFELHIQPVPEGIFILSMDISRRKEAENELMRLNESLEEQIAMRTLELESKNRDMLDSLQYAKNIQKAFLPDKQRFLKLFPAAFLINKPKDIVSGDFYWYREVADKILLAAADCTGHGVPGALMSMIGIEKLSNIALKTTDPSEVLQRLNKSIKIALNNSTLHERCFDGMDIAVCLIDRMTRKVLYAGAHRPLWIIRNGTPDVEEIKATKKAIGGFTENDQHFESHLLQLQKGDRIYLFSDGYADTFSGKTRQKKITTKRFRRLLLEIQHQKLEEQRKFLEHFVEEWRGTTEQIDDILVIGIQL